MKRLLEAGASCAQVCAVMMVVGLSAGLRKGYMLFAPGLQVPVSLG
jgi:hypothetical protein